MYHVVKLEQMPPYCETASTAVSAVMNEILREYWQYEQYNSGRVYETKGLLLFISSVSLPARNMRAQTEIKRVDVW